MSRVEDFFKISGFGDTWFTVLYADIGTSEQDLVNNTFIIYDGCDGKSDSDDENSEDHLQADEREMKPENEIAPG